ncbi:MAG: pyridoxine 5'-phosphate synthase, partial [Bosea sp. (in: a-proteobacteria)]
MIRLGVNIDHAATVRNARGGRLPDPVRAAHLAVAAGADGITAHLREDRRHIRDDDMERLARELTVPLNFEMGATGEMIALAERLKPHAACLVPEKREERTTEGGLDVVGQEKQLMPAIARLKAAGCRVSLFIEADEAPIAMSAKLGAPVVELHTGSWCHAVMDGHHDKAQAELRRLKNGARI